jgi:putative DNA primase/helicase
MAAWKAEDLCTDSKLTAAFAAEYGDRARYVRGVRMWIAWDEREQRWRRDDEAQVGAYVGDFVRSLLLYAATLPREEAFALAEIGVKAESKFRRQAIFALASKERGLWSDLSDFDRDPYLLHCANGTVDLRTSKLREHRREDFITMSTGGAYKPEARSLAWRKVLVHTLPDARVRSFVQRLAGYSAVGSAREDRFAVVFGDARAGKGTFLSSITSALGEYATSEQPEFFAKQAKQAADRERATPSLAALIGKRMLAIYETQEGMRLDAAFVKSFTGSDGMKVRGIYSKKTEAQLVATPWLSTNHRPAFPYNEQALMERLVCVPTGGTIPRGKRDPKLRERLRDDPRHKEAVLAWIVAGAKAYLAHGLGELPPAIAAANEAYYREMNPLAAFLADRATLGPSLRVGAQDLRDAYEHWHHSSQLHAWIIPLNQKWGEALEAAGLRQRESNTGTHWHGLDLKPDTLMSFHETYSERIEKRRGAAATGLRVGGVDLSDRVWKE